MFLLIFLFSIASFAASEWQQTPHSQVRLLQAFDQIGDKTFELALHIELEPEWHTYWLNPGDSASSLNLDVKVNGKKYPAKIKWPIPKRIPVSPLYSFGYEKEVVIPFKVLFEPKDYELAKIEVSAEFLVCKIACLPAFPSWELEIPILAAKSITSKDFVFWQKEKFPGEAILTWDYKIEKDQVFLSGLQEGRYIDFLPEDNRIINNKPLKMQGEYLIAEKSLQFTNETIWQGLYIYYENEELKANQVLFRRSPSKDFDLSLLFFAFLGGLLLNLMPCVLPVLSLKVFSLAKEKEHVTSSSLMYSAGVLFSFLLLASILFAFRSVGQNLGWGFQLQSPLFVGLLFFLFLAMGAHFLGLWEVQIRLGQKGQGLLQKQGLAGEFFTGVLAVVVASPCTAPFMGVALGAALQAEALYFFLSFLGLGLGLCFPFLLMSFLPAKWIWLPKPGPWMEKLKEFLAFPLFATSLWLLLVYSQQKGEESAFTLSLLGLFLFFLLWSIRRLKQKLFSMALLFAFAGLIYAELSNTEKAAPQLSNESAIWKNFSEQAIAESRAAGRKVFVDFTATWCITCQVNKKTTLRREEMLQWFNKNGYDLYQADWTSYDQNITSFLQKYNRAGVPFYIAFDQKGNEKILPELLSIELLQKQLKDF